MDLPVLKDMSTPLRAAGPVGSATSWVAIGFSESEKIRKVNGRQMVGTINDIFS